jgi:hypothetical protein
LLKGGRLTRAGIKSGSKAFWSSSAWHECSFTGEINTSSLCSWNVVFPFLSRHTSFE